MPKSPIHAGHFKIGRKVSRWDTVLLSMKIDRLVVFGFTKDSTTEVEWDLVP